MSILTVSPFAEKKIKQGKQLLLAEDFPNIAENNQLVYLYSQSKDFLGTGYLSSQNKGIGWFLSPNKEKLTVTYFQGLFERAKAKRQSYYDNELTTAFRLFNQDGDDFGGLTIDLYGDYALFSWYNAFVYSLKDVIVEAFQTVFPEVLGGYEKIRFKGLDFESDHLYGQEAADTFTILENGVTYEVFLNDGLMTGIFLDQKNVRGALAGGLSTGKTLLNMFSYTGAFSVAAAFGGSSQTTSVDLAKRSLDKTREQFLVNGIEPESQKIYVMDVFGYFNYAKKKELTYDMIVLDPPSFARNGKKTFSVAKNYGDLVKEAVEILENNGTLIASTNAANVSDKKFRQMIEEALKNKGVKFTVFQEEKLPADFHIADNFPEGNYLKVLFIKIKK